ncbi:unannotated protein [freshwater metagenome]|uniref:Unannotated protein n=1 Tax=freshwater metagenome TaxID=449393 RepID=A0A6J6CNB6_9ZZZZ
MIPSSLRLEKAESLIVVEIRRALETSISTAIETAAKDAMFKIKKI